ncbi:hypothetical protein CROQUDRAFT_656106 [Cronartium quercuum f. sp. fusiforme G11]|uniref:Uncharacterized protein n=1 Tax=Cronartium quercuum f. sp. fusiforme G11 TaxID=708437 RepID=A0A9P6NPS9_9BASI|nr:hypothetical protein CROQUDRAFT_656106 [Cronartium quercuum f. sp. fusiforme G11]
MNTITTVTPNSSNQNKGFFFFFGIREGTVNLMIAYEDASDRPGGLETGEKLNQLMGSVVLNEADKMLKQKLQSGATFFESLYVKGDLYNSLPIQCFRCLDNGHMPFHCTKKKMRFNV